MDAVLRAAFMYLFLLVILRVAGNRTLSEITIFDLVLLLVISEAAQQAISGEDYSVANAVVIISVLVFIDVIFSLVKQKYPSFDKIVEGTPLIIVRNGVPEKKLMAKARVDEDDVLEAARRLRGLERMDQVKYAILEKDGSITIVAIEPDRISK